MPLDVSDADTLEVSFVDVDIFISTEGQRLEENVLLTRPMVELFPSKYEAALLSTVGKAFAGIITAGFILSLIS